MADDPTQVSDGASERLPGGLANAGAVVRRGVAVRRPAPPHAPAVHRFLAALRDGGYHGAPAPRRLEPGEGWEELEFLHGDVALPPFPAWAMTDATLASVGARLRRYHEASAQVPIEAGVDWPTDLADPDGGPVLCHDDVCPENVVFRDGAAAAFIDFDFAAPGRPVWDVAMTARYWVPLLDPQSADVSHRGHLDPIRRTRVLWDAYGLGDDDRAGFADVVVQTIAVARRFIEVRVGAGIPAFVAAFEQHGGWARWDRIEAWLDDYRRGLEALMSRGR